MLEPTKNSAIINGVKIAWLEQGEGTPFVLVHGFASKAEVNWLGTGWMKRLAQAGYRAIALDNRGHGDSEKFYADEDYSLEKMAGDVGGLIDHLGLKAPHVMGYSMGARISVTLASLRGGDLGKLIIAGNGYNMIEGGSMNTDEVRDALLAPSLADVPPGVGHEFRTFAEKTGNDLKALAACIRGRTIPRDTFENLTNETLVIVGTEDDLATHPDTLAALIPHGNYEPIPKRNHMNAVGDKVYIEKVLDFIG